VTLAFCLTPGLKISTPQLIMNIGFVGLEPGSDFKALDRALDVTLLKQSLA
jgi:hypothetical protein